MTNSLVQIRRRSVTDDLSNMRYPTVPAPQTSTSLGRGPWVFVFVIVILLVGGIETDVVWAQDRSVDSLSLAERYRMARVRALAQEYLMGRRTLPVLPVEHLATPVDSLYGSSSSDDDVASKGKEDLSFEIEDVRRVRALERSWFRDRYRDVEWSFLGAGMRLSFFDTTRTRDLRARLQAQYGDPTRTLAEVYSNEWVASPDSTREDPIQYEYWFVVNDSLPVRVSDVDGPGGRGVIFSTSRTYRQHIEALRAALLHPLRENERAPYVDYYHNEDTRRWYRVGYDGRTFFRERIARFDIVPGRRPRLDTIKAGADREMVPE